MRSCSLLIADPDRAHLDLLVRRLKKQPRLKIVAAVDNGLDALSQIRTCRPDFVLMDLCMPKFDGIYVLKETTKMKKRPEVICMAAMFSRFLVEAVRRYGAACCVYKPAAPEMIENLLLECVDFTEREERSAEKDENSLELRIHEMLNALGFSPRHSGTRYLAEAVECAVQTGKGDESITKLYQRLSAQNAASLPQIERCIRIAIHAANADFRLQKEIGEKPTNKAVIQYLTKSVQHWMEE